MVRFRFEIQNCIKVEIEANNQEEARMQIINNLDDYADQMVDGSCYVSNGEQLNAN